MCMVRERRFGMRGSWVLAAARLASVMAMVVTLALTVLRHSLHTSRMRFFSGGESPPMICSRRARGRSVRGLGSSLSSMLNSGYEIERPYGCWGRARSCARPTHVRVVHTCVESISFGPLPRSRVLMRFLSCIICLSNRACISTEPC